MFCLSNHLMFNCTSGKIAKVAGKWNRSAGLSEWKGSCVSGQIWADKSDLGRGRIKSWWQKKESIKWLMDFKYHFKSSILNIISCPVHLLQITHCASSSWTGWWLARAVRPRDRTLYKPSGALEKEHLLVILPRYFCPEGCFLESKVIFFKIGGTEGINGLTKETWRTYWLSGGECLYLTLQDLYQGSFNSQSGLAQRQFYSKSQISSSLDVLTPYSKVSKSHPFHLMSFISNRVPGLVKSCSSLLTAFPHWSYSFLQAEQCEQSSVKSAQRQSLFLWPCWQDR